MSELKLKFDATLDYQRDAIASVVDLFTGLTARRRALLADIAGREPARLH